MLDKFFLFLFIVWPVVTLILMITTWRGRKHMSRRMFFQNVLVSVSWPIVVAAIVLDAITGIWK